MTTIPPGDRTGSVVSRHGRCDALLEWSVVGSFGSIGYRLRSPDWERIPGDALADRVVVITGATSGIGRAVATGAARLGARLRFVARDPDKASDLERLLREQSPHGDISFYLADLSVMSQVSAVSQQILDTEPRIDVLINNVGVLPQQRIETPEGLELAYATDLLGPFLLTNRLRKRMVDSAPARIISVVSGGMYTQGLELEDPNYAQGDYHGSVAYARAKRGMMVLTKIWADQLAGTGVTANAVHPGWVDTPGVRNSLPMFHRIARPLLRTPEQGADTVLWLATSPVGVEATGKLWHDRAVRAEYRLKSTVETPADRDRLWAKLTETADQLAGGR
ncbi:MAG: SDR family NAD(P)-dependent oxidoreductase [Acidimicrobiia bacterium]